MNKKNKEKFSRKEALEKMGKYAAMTALGTFIILNPKKAQASSPPDPGDNPFGEATYNDKTVILL